ncbi:MAG: hypothetical protein ABH836_08640 [Candidatus Omnitrophota bacterium]
MRKIVFFAVLVTIVFVSSFSYAQDKKKILLSTTSNINQPYEVIGIVYGRINTADIRDLNEELESRAGNMNADAVVEVRYLLYVGYLYAYGTAVKFKE